MKKIRGRKSRDIYIYDEEKLTLTDKEGNIIKLYESLDGLSDNNIVLLVDELFHEFYLLQNRFSLLSREYKNLGIEWSDGDGIFHNA